jgi:ribose transport system ATP-binding protein
VTAGDRVLAEVGRSALSAEGVVKSFGATKALKGVRLQIDGGEVHALIGGNGCGKSTLIKCLAGVYQADEGRVTIFGRDIDLSSHTPDAARAAGLRFDHQDPGIFPTMSLTENLFLADGFARSAGRIDWSASHQRAREILERFDIRTDPRQPAAMLSVPQRAMLAIARALQDIDETQRAVLVLDEPTAALPAAEVHLLLESIRRLAAQGHAILIVTHRLDEVRQVADRVTAFRDGGYVDTVPGENLTEQTLVELILGRRLEAAASVSGETSTGDVVLQVDGLVGGPLRGVNLTVRTGEVLGIAGLLGSGRTELLQMIYGLTRPSAGTIRHDGKLLAGGHRASQSTRSGMAFVPEDRAAEAVFPVSSVLENMVAGHERRYFRGGWLRDGRKRAEVRQDITRFGIRTAGTSAYIENLSGGNQQKVVVARWLRQEPRLLLLDEPTQGVDVGARDDIYKLIAAAADQGCAVIVVSSEFEELARICGRVVVLSHGRITQELRQPVQAHEILQVTIKPSEVAV